MLIRPLTSADHGVYAAFRRQLWPYHAAAGHWEALEVKYFLNPLCSLCPESGLYGYFQGDQLCGVIGAYPMPVTLGGIVHPGHMVADYCVLHNLWFSPVAGRLWNELLQLPGRKFASNGSRYSQGPIQKRGVKIRAVQAFGLVRPLRALSAKLFRLHYYCYPSPFLPGQIKPCRGVEAIEAGPVRAAVPPASEKTAWIQHSAEFWKFYCQARMYNGAIPLRIRSAQGEADLVMTLWETGPAFRFATLLSAHLVPYTATCATSVGRALGRFLRRMNVTILFATEADAELAKLVEKASWYVHRIPTHWWALPKSSDRFAHDSVSWWLTSAARDSNAGGLQPCTPA
jgi:hypothetical protein